MPAPSRSVPPSLESRTVDVLGTLVHGLEDRELWQAIEQSIETGVALSLLSVGLDWLRLGRGADAGTAAAFDLHLIDGKPVQWVTESILGHRVPKLSGSDLVPELCRRSADTGWRLFLLGAAPGVADQAAARAAALYPGCRIVGVASPSPRVVDDAAASRQLCKQINAAAPDILLVAFGQPRQERWLVRHADDLDVPVRAGVGASIDFLSGRVRRAPVWMQHRGLEWAWRLALEPRRLWRRYLVHDLPVAISAATVGVRARRRAMALRSVAGVRAA